MSTQPQLDFMAPLGRKAARPEVGETGRERKRQGQARAAGKHSVQLAEAQAIAEGLGAERSVTIEDVRERYEQIWRQPWTLGNAAGSVFSGDEWECVGYTVAKRPEAHARILRVWRLR